MITICGRKARNRKAAIPSFLAPPHLGLVDPPPGRWKHQQSLIFNLCPSSSKNSWSWSLYKTEPIVPSENIFAAAMQTVSCNISLCVPNWRIDDVWLEMKDDHAHHNLLIPPPLAISHLHIPGLQHNKQGLMPSTASSPAFPKACNQIAYYIWRPQTVGCWTTVYKALRHKRS